MDDLAVDFTRCECTDCICNNYVDIYEDDNKDQLFICVDCINGEHQT